MQGKTTRAVGTIPEPIDSLARTQPGQVSNNATIPEMKEKTTTADTGNNLESTAVPARH